MVFLHGIFILGLCIWGSNAVTVTDIPIEIDHACHIRIKICGEGFEPDTMYFEINNNRIVTGDCDYNGTYAAASRTYYYFFGLTGSCRMISYMDIYSDSSFDEDDWINKVYKTLHMTPFGGYFIMISRSGFQQDIRKFSNFTASHATVMDDLGFIWDSVGDNAELDSIDDYDYEVVTTYNDTRGDPALAVVFQKTLDGERLLKTLGPEHGTRFIDLEIKNVDHCIEPLGPFDQLKHDTSVYGLNDQLEANNPREMHIDVGNMIGCSGTVYGWEFIPANDEEIAYFTVGYRDGSNLFLVGIHKIPMGDSIITDSLEINYVCHRHEPIRNVDPGYFYGFMTEDESGAAIAPPIKIVFPIDYSAARYPCSKQFTWGEVSVITLYNRDIANDRSFSQSDLERTFSGAMALRPIMDQGFMYHCKCSEDQDCHEYRDINMICQNSVCECREYYVYNRRHNRCLFANIPYNGTDVYQSSVLDDLEMWEPEAAVDEDSEAHILNGTCAMTKEARNPWYIVDLGMEVTVYGVELTTPIPLDVYLEAWETIADPPPNPVPDPDCFLHDDKYDNLTATSHCGVDTMQRIDVHGPFPWKIETEDQSDFEILNREYRDGVRTYYYNKAAGSNMGSVGIYTQRVSRIVDFGYIQFTDDLSCWAVSNDTVIKLTKAAGDECTGVVVYVEPTSGDENDYYIRRLSDSYTLGVHSFTQGAKVSFGSDSTSFQIFATSGSITDFADLYDGVYIKPTNDDTKCLQFDGSSPPELILSGTCDTLYLHEMFDETLPMYKYRQEDYNDTTDGDIPYFGVNITSDTEGIPCYEIFKAKDVDGGGVTYVNNGTWIYVAAKESYNGSFEDSDPLIFRSNIVGVRDFNVHVGNFFDENSFNTGVFRNYSLCNQFKGSPLNGKPFLVECQKPVRGRYVGIYLNSWNPFDKIQLCNLRVFSLKGKAYQSYCNSNEDCEWFRDSATGDQNLVCIKDSVSDKYGLCECDKGYVYHTEAELCVDVDECRDPVVQDDPAGIEKCLEQGGNDESNGTCVNLIGSYTCDCPVGYRYVVEERDGEYPLRGVCTDIDEANELNCGCEGSCTNGVMDVDGYSFVCTCPHGFQLASDGLGCEDIDECSYTATMSRILCLEPQEIESYGDLNFCLMMCAKKEDCVGVQEFVGENCTLVAGCSDVAYTGEPDFNLYIRRDPGEEDLYQCIFDYREGLELGNFTEEESPSPVGCENSVGSYKCICPQGYEYVDKMCVNINECPGRCEDGCTDKEPEIDALLYECDCNGLDGYELSNDGYSCIDTDECEQGIDTCTSSVYDAADEYLTPPVQKRYKAWCKNTVGSYHCECPPGFYYDEVNDWCEDIDECSSPAKIHECEDQCINVNGSYECDCDIGYTLSLNQHSCEDIDECSENPNICDAAEPDFPVVVDRLCENEIGSYICYCDTGYVLMEDNCVDINECTEETPCEDHCENRYFMDEGLLYECFCNDLGYRLSNDSHTCIDVDECEGENICAMDINATCINTISSYYCVCEEGYAWESMSNSCVDIDECEMNNAHCTDNCTNTPGSYECSCEIGFQLTNNEHTCEDLDECNMALDDCSDICKNTEGSYVCSCFKGRMLTPDGVTCMDINECSIDNGGCEQRCTNTLTEGPLAAPALGVTCSCFPGYELLNDFRGCADIDECIQPTDNDCDQICHNTVGSYMCSCNEGYKLDPDGITCLDIDECVEEDNGGCMMNCTNTMGSFRCSCFSGYNLDSNLKTCTDINECDENNGDCQQICINTPGSYKCACDGQYVLIDDGFKCSGLNVIELRSKMALPYIEEYSDTSSPEYKALKQWLEINFSELCRDIQLRTRGISRCEIEGPFFPTTEASLQTNPLQLNPTDPVSSGRSPAGRQGNTEQNAERTPTSSGNPDSSGTRTHLANTLAETAEERVRYEAFPGSIVGFDVVIRSDDTITDQEQGELSYIVANLLDQNGNMVVVNGTKVQLVDDPLFINVEEDGSENLFAVKSLCDFFIETNYCMNGGFCEVVGDSPVCKCKDGYAGPRCDAKPSTFLKTKDIAVVSALIGLAIICVFLTIGLCYALLRKTDSASLHRSSEGYFPNLPSIAWRNSYGDYFK